MCWAGQQGRPALIDAPSPDCTTELAVNSESTTAVTLTLILLTQVEPLWFYRATDGQTRMISVIVIITP